MPVNRVNLEVSYLGLNLKNPILAGAAGTTAHFDSLKQLEEAGVAGVVLKSYQEETVNHHVPFPRFKILKNGVQGYRSHTFYSYEQAFEGNLADYGTFISKVKDELEIPVIASLECSTVEGWIEGARLAEEAGADALEIVPSCPVGFLMRDQEYDFTSYTTDIVKKVRENTGLPIAVKLSPQLENPTKTAVEMEGLGVKGVVLFNRFTGLDVDIKTQKPVLHGGIAGHGGPWMLNLLMRWLANTYNNINIPMSATGGITGGEDIIKTLLTGATTVQVVSLLYLKGAGTVKKVVNELERYCQENEIADLSSLVGKTVPQIKTLQEVIREGKYLASINQDRCIQCGRCLVCIYNAVEEHGDAIIINKDKCDGCGLCPQLCPKEAITIDKVGDK